jgi:hypothetical protein
MTLSNAIPIAAAVVSGTFLLLGYVFQKFVEHRRTVAEKRRETYSMFLKNTLAAIESRTSRQAHDQTEEVFWRAQVALYGSVEVIERLAQFINLLPRLGEAHRSTQIQIAAAADALMLAMRRDILPRTRTKVERIREVSPFLVDRE